MAVVTAVSWAVLAIALKYALHHFSSGTIVWARMIVAFAVLAGIFAWKNPSQLKILMRPPWAGLLAGAFLAVNYFGFMKGVELTTASNAQIMIQLAPLSFAALSIVIFREIPNWRQLFGMVIALCGFGFFYWDQFLVSLQNVHRFQAGNFWVLLASATWAIFALIQKQLIKTYRPQQFNLLVYGVSAILMFPTANFPELSPVGWGDAALLLFLALNTVVGYGALSEALARAPASHVSMIIAANPLLTLLIMGCLTRMEVEWIKGEPVGWRGIIGAVLVVIGVISTVYQPPSWTPRARAPKL
jgi:drug/metabolite transporter (DMT)-like permease